MKFESGDLALCPVCGTQYDVPLSIPPKSCRICDDPRQYVPATGQTWTSLHLEQPHQQNSITTDPNDPRIHYISTGATDPAARKQLGIGQRAIFLETGAGNVLWDAVAFLDEATVAWIRAKGGLKAIVISHPHFYTTHLEWARVFGCQVWTAADDAEWLNRKDGEGRRRYFKGAEEVVKGVTVVQAGGHFEGSSVLHWDRKLFIADTMMSVPSGFQNAAQPDRHPDTVTYSFMWAYPNMIPLPPSKIHGIWKAIKPYDFDTTYGGFTGQTVSRSNLKEQVLESMRTFIKLGGHEHAEIFKETL